MQLNAFHDMIAAISAYISLLEHDLVLSIPFTELDPNQYDLIDVIGLRWRDKWNLILDNKPDSQHFRQRLYDVVERWRNPYSHGGFEKGHDATLWLHAPPIGIFPVGLTRIRDSPLFSLMPAGETNIADVFTFFGEVDTWFSDQLPEATRLIASGLDVRYDADFRLALSEAHATGSFNDFLQYREYRQDMVDNMDC